jgi:hypothetical protein
MPSFLRSARDLDDDGTGAGPAILAGEAAEASHTSGKKTSKAAVGAAAFAAAVAAAAGHMHIGSMAVVAACAVIAAMAGRFLFHGWRESLASPHFVTEAKQ